MPVTFLHYCAAHLINKVKIGFVLPALIVGSLIPDLEPFAAIVTGERLGSRGLLHSVWGAVTLDTYLAVLITVVFYPVVVSWIFRLEKKDVAEKCRFSGMLVLSALFGCLSHILIDSTSHEYNPLLYPFSLESFDALILMGDWLIASTIVHIALLVLLLLIMLKEFTRGSKEFWRHLLVE